MSIRENVHVANRVYEEAFVGGVTLHGAAVGEVLADRDRSAVAWRGTRPASDAARPAWGKLSATAADVGRTATRYRLRNPHTASFAVARMLLLSAAEGPP